MRKSLFVTIAVAALMASAPASAQVFFSDDPAAGDGSEAAAVPAYGGYRYRVVNRYFGWSMICRVGYSSRLTRDGRVVTTPHRSCW